MAFRDPSLVPFLVTPRRNRPAVDPTELPAGLPPLLQVDPQRLEHADFCGILQRLDQLAFGPMGLEMPGWVFYDCSAMPGVVFGLGAPVDQVRGWMKRVLGVPEGYTGIVPLTLFIAIAMLPRRSWLVHTVMGMNDVAPGATHEGAVRETLAAGLALLSIDTLYGTLQWRSPTLRHCTSLGPLEVLTAWTPAHDVKSTLTFRLQVPEDAPDLLLGGAGHVHSSAPPPNEVIDVDRSTHLRRLQARVESGDRVWVVAPPAEVGRYSIGLLHAEGSGP